MTQIQEGETVFLPEESLQKKLMHNGFWLYFLSFIAAPAGYIIKIIVAREMSVEEIGMLYSILSIIGIISTYNDLGLTEALQYYLPHYLIDKKYSEAKTIIVFTWLAQFVSGIIIGGGLFFLAPYIAERYFHSDLASGILRLFCIYFLINNLFQVLQSIFISIQNVKWVQGLEAVRVWGVVLFTFLIAFYSHLTVYTFSVAWFGGLIIAIILAFIGFRKQFFKEIQHSKVIFHRNLLKKQWLYGFWVMLGMSASSLFGQINQLLAQYWLGSKIAGYWSYYLAFYSVLNLFIAPIVSYLFPLLNELYKKGSYEKIRLLYKILFSGVAIFSLIASVISYFYAEYAAVLMRGEKFRYVGTMFTYFAPFIFTIPIIGIMYQDIASRGLVRERFYSLVLGLLFNVLASRRLVKSYGVIGLIYGQIIGNIILVLVGVYYYKKSHHISE